MLVLKDAFSDLLHNKLALAALLALPLICGIFSTFYVSSFIDPTERLRSLPVAVINEDTGAWSNDEQFYLGNEVVDALIESGDAQWTLEDAGLLTDGLEHTDYFMALVIPADFSEQVMAGATDEPQTAELIFWRNERRNYTLSQLSARIEAGLRESVRAMVTEQYTEALAQGLIDAQAGLSDAAEGAGELTDGMQTLSEGLEDAASGSVQLGEGAELLSESTDVLAEGSTALAEGVHTLNDSAGALPAGVALLDEGAQTLYAGTTAAVLGTDALHAASLQLSTGIDTLSSQLAVASGASASLAQGLDSVYGSIGSASSPGTLQFALAQASYCVGMAQLADSSGGSAAGQSTSQWLALASVALGGASTGLTTLQGSIGTPDAGGTLSFGAAQLQTGLDSALGALGSPDIPGQTLAYGAAQLEGGLDTLNTQLALMETGAGTLAEGTSGLVASAGELTAGTQELASAVDTLDEGAEALASGAAELSDSTATLVEGLSTASDGARDALEGSSTLEVELLDGALDLEESAPSDASAFAEYLGSPVEMTEDTFGPLDYFGFGFAPLFASVALWVGALMNSIVLSSFPSRKVKAGRCAVVFGRLPLYLLFGLAETLAVAFAMWLIGVPIFNWPLALFFLFVVSATFVAIIQMLSLVLGLPGKALVILLTILQLAGTSGTFPVELSTDFLQVATHWLPFTYAIDGIREFMSGSSVAVVTQNVLALVLFILGALAFGLVFFPLGVKIEKQVQKRLAAELG